MSPTREYGWLLTIALAGTLLRLFRLGELSFGGDEEITTLAALALLDGWPPTLPGGLVYIRALSFTALEAIAISIGGTQESVLRLIPVLFAFPRIIGIWWLARAFLPASLALACAGLLALAPFDIEHSRIARMYSPFATLDLLFVAALVHLSLDRRMALRASLFGVAAVSMHTLTIFHAPLAWLAALAHDISSQARRRLLLAGAAVLVGFLFFHLFEGMSYAPMGLGPESESPLPAALREHVERLGAAVTGWRIALLVIGCAIAAPLFYRGFLQLTDPWSKVLFAASALLFLGSSPLLAIASSIAGFILEGARVGASVQHGRLREALHSPWLAGLVAGSILCAIWAVLGVMTRSADEGALRAAASMLLGYPAPNWLDMVRASPALTLLAVLGIAIGTWNCAKDRTSAAAWLILIGAALAPSLGTGLVRRSEALRFQMHSFAPLLVLAVFGAWRSLRELSMPRLTATVAAAAVVLLAVRPDRGLAVVLREHGPIDAPFAIFAVAPDHRGAGLFVRQHAGPDDWIVAEDSLQQRLYAGRADFWLRRQQDANAFLTKVSVSAAPIDIYTGAELMPDFESLIRRSSADPSRIFWLITSAEAESAAQTYRTATTSEALNQIRPLARFVGRDGITRVYKIRAGNVEGPDTSRPVSVESQ